MKIAITVDPEIPVPPKLYGGIERIVDMLAIGLEARGHECVLFANRDSDRSRKLIPWMGEKSSSTFSTIMNASTLSTEILFGDFDLIHSFSRLAYLTPILPFPIPKLMTYQRPITRRTVGLARTLSRGSLSFTGISRQMIRDVSDLAPWHVIPNGVPLTVYQCRREVDIDAPLVFLGRIEEQKGTHLAIEISKRVCVPLIIAGPVIPEKQEWFNKFVEPHVDGDFIRYIGPVDDKQKNQLLGGARAFLMPVLWDEPFGIVMAEAMACGAPVLGLNRGAVPEVVEDGVTGFVRDDVDGLVEAFEKIDQIDRQNCRARVEALYSDTVVVDSYLRLYQRLLAGEHRTTGLCGSA